MRVSTPTLAVFAALMSLVAANPVPTRPKDAACAGPTDCEPPRFAARTTMVEREAEAEANTCPPCSEDWCPPCSPIPQRKRHPEPARPTDIYICPSCQPDSCPPCTYIQGKRDLTIEDEGLAKRMAEAKALSAEGRPIPAWKREAEAEALRSDGPCNDIDCPPRPIPAWKREAASCDGDHCEPNRPIPAWKREPASCDGDHCEPNRPIPSFQRREADANAMLAACPPCFEDWCPPCDGGRPF